MNWLAEREKLIYGLGTLLGPIFEMMDNWSQENADRAKAKFHHDRQLFTKAVEAFCKRPGYTFEHVRIEVLQALNQFSFAQLDPSQRNRLESTRDSLINRISSIPVDVPSETLEAHAPFEAYCKIRDRCLAARNRLTVVDEYLKSSVFYRYLRGLTCEKLVVVTRNGIPNDPEFMSVSKLMANERGPDRYRLVTHPASYLHDRHLRADDLVYALGASLDYVAEQSYSSLGLPDDSASANSLVDALESGGTELFGPTVAIHP